VVRGGVEFAGLDELRTEIERQYKELESEVAGAGIHEAAAVLPAGMRYQASASAMGLDGFDGWEAVVRALNPGVIAAVQEWFDGRAAVVRDVTWVRRQYPAALRVAGQAPHALHQDGAYGFAFPDGAGGTAGDLQDMVTAWIPLCPAGVDAPGLEFRFDSPKRLLGLAELGSRSTDESGVAPRFEPGDVVLMAGHHVHRTHVTDAMTRARTAIELRFVGETDGNARLPGPRVPLGALLAI
jgi:hypothetical protein